MDKGQKAVAALIFIVLPAPIAWFLLATKINGLNNDNISSFGPKLLAYTVEFHLAGWYLWALPIAASIGGLALVTTILKGQGSTFRGEKYKKWLRGASLTTQKKLAHLTKERKKEQVTIANVPIPSKLETSHFSIAGRTGAGKTNILKEMMLSALKRRDNIDRLIVLDSDGEFVETFYRPGIDYILNPFDARTEGWNFFNEIENDFDYERFAKSVIQPSSSGESEEWNDYGRTLFRAVAKKVAESSQNPTMDLVYEWTNRVEMEELKEFCKGTEAEGIFSGPEKATASARFVLSNELNAHLKMPNGDFSLNEWVNDEKGGNLFITWDEKQREAVMPLVSCWTDTLLDQVMALKSSKSRRIWAFLDEIESLGQLPSIHKAITRGRKKGLRVVAGFQSYSQLRHVYGNEMATTMLSSLSTVIALATTRSGTDTAELMSKTLGEHEVTREKEGESRQSFGGGSTKSTNKQSERERVVMPSEISALDDNTGYLAFSGSLPIAYIEFSPVNYYRNKKVPAFIPIDEGLDFLTEEDDEDDKETQLAEIEEDNDSENDLVLGTKGNT